MNPVNRGGRETLVARIEDALKRSGEYVTEVDSGPTQHMVDLHWCAHSAARRLGLKVRVVMTEPPQLHRTDHDERVTMTVRPRESVPWFRIP